MPSPDPLSSSALPAGTPLPGNGVGVRMELCPVLVTWFFCSFLGGMTGSRILGGQTSVV